MDIVNDKEDVVSTGSFKTSVVLAIIVVIAALATWQLFDLLGVVLLMFDILLLQVGLLMVFYNLIWGFIFRQTYHRSWLPLLINLATTMPWFGLMWCAVG